MEYYQTTLFQETEVEEIRSGLEKTRKELGNVRRGLFSRHEDLAEEQRELFEKIQALKSELQSLKDEIVAIRQIQDLALSAGDAVGVSDGLRSTFCPVSSSMILSHSCSTGLSFPK